MRVTDSYKSLFDEQYAEVANRMADLIERMIKSNIQLVGPDNERFLQWVEATEGSDKGEWNQLNKQPNDFGPGYASGIIDVMSFYILNGDVHHHTDFIPGTFDFSTGTVEDNCANVEGLMYYYVRDIGATNAKVSNRDLTEEQNLAMDRIEEFIAERE